MTTHEVKRTGRDIIEMWKILHNMEDVDGTKYFVRDTSSRRGHSYKLFKRWFNKDVWKYSFTNRQVDLWNSLPADTVEAPTMDILKARLDRYVTEKGGFI